MRNYMEKAKVHFLSALLLYENNFYNDAISRLYYSFRSMAISVVGKPPKGKWKHSALMRKFVMEVDRLKIFSLTREERRLIKDFAEARENADYELVNIPREVVESYIKLVERFLREVKDAESNHEN